MRPVKTPPALAEKIIDFHVHLFPDRLFDAIRRRFLSDYGWEVLHQDYYWQDCIHHLRTYGVGPIVYSNYAHRPGMAALLNEWNRQILKETEEVFCFLAYHPDDPTALADIEPLLGLPRVMGVKLHFLVQRFHPQDRKLYGLYEKVAAAGKYLLLHVGNGPVGNEFVGIANFRRLLEDFPDLPAIVAHMGGLEYGEFGLLLNRHPALYLDTSYSFLPPLGRMFDLGNEFLEVNRERILYGSDFPNVLFPRELEIETLLALDLSEDFYRRVFWENGRALIERITGCSGGLINQTASVSVTGRP